MEKAAETSNGVETPAKIAGMSEVLFGIVTMMVSQKLDGGYGRLQGLYRVIEACKWQITIIAGIIGTCLIFRPDLSALLTKLVQAM